MPLDFHCRNVVEQVNWGAPSITVWYTVAGNFSCDLDASSSNPQVYYVPWTDVQLQATVTKSNAVRLQPTLFTGDMKTEQAAHSLEAGDAAWCFTLPPAPPATPSATNASVEVCVTVVSATLGARNYDASVELQTALTASGACRRLSRIYNWRYHCPRQPVQQHRRV